MIAGVVGYDSIRKHLAECGYHTVEIRGKYHPYGCVHRKLEDMGCKDMIVAASGDGILIADKERSGYMNSPNCAICLSLLTCWI